MARLVAGAVLCAVLACAAAVAAAGEKSAEAVSSYIVHVAHANAPRSSRPRLLARAYTSFLRDALPESIARPEPTVFYSYARAATGFAARLTAQQAAHLASQPSVLAVVPDLTYEPHTTLTPSFLGLSESFGLLKESKGATDVVIGMIDSGVYPKDRPSFAAADKWKPPSKFRGRCVSTPSFNATAYCNNKLVGAKFFFAGYEAKYGKIDEAAESKSPLDTVGHGTHTASIAAGSPAANANLFDYGQGKAVGTAPGARIAAYKVLWKRGGVASDILMAFDEAIADGVDVISVSVGPKGKIPSFHEDGKAIGALSAVRKGIVVSASAGNSGPDGSTVGNAAPWILTVGASTINRRFAASVVLGNGEAFAGTSLYAGKPLGEEAKIPLVYRGDAGSDFCEAGKLNATMVVGRIVVCQPYNTALATKGEAVRLAGGAGAIVWSFPEYGEDTETVAHVLPATEVTFADGQKILNYIQTNAHPVATIMFHGTVVGSEPSSPRVGSFSSRGPSLHAPEILKPDVVAPGVDILAAWTGENSPTGLKSDTRRVQYNVDYGTSMACPHVSGIAAMLRQARPGWSPAAIKSALMTTASDSDRNRLPIRDMASGETSNPFAYGAGHVSPNAALDPGLVYDAGFEDYIDFLCALGYDPNMIALFTRDAGSVTDCSERTAASASYVGDHNYPAFSLAFVSAEEDEVVTQRRVVRNVGSNATATYTPRVTSPPGVLVTVDPPKLQFDATHKTLEYEVTFEKEPSTVTKKHTFGSLVWSDGVHRVASPIAVTWPADTTAAEM